MSRDAAGEALRDAHRRCAHLESMVRRLVELAGRCGATHEQITEAIAPQGETGSGRP